MTTIQESVQRKNTRAYIETNPSDLVLIRRKKNKTPDGGWQWSAGEQLAPQHCRLIRSGNKGDNMQRTTPDGRVLVVLGTLVFSPEEADVEVGDKFLDEEHWEVTQVTKNPTWRVTAEVSSNA